MSHWVRHYYAPAILHSKVKIGILAFAAAMFIVSIVAATQVSSGVSQNDVLPDKSYVKEYGDIDQKYFSGFNMGTDIILGTFDYADERNQDYVFDLAERVAQSKAIVPPVHSWLSDYFHWLQNSRHNDSLTDKGRPPSSAKFYLWLYEFLADPSRGMAYSSDIVFQFGAIKASRLKTKHSLEVLSTDFRRAEALVEMRALTKDAPIPAFLFSWRYIPWDQYIGMVESNVIQFSLVAAAILLIVLFFLGNFTASLITMGALVMIDIDLLGMMYFWNIPLSNVSMINLLLSLGLAVDACAHVVHSVNLELERQIHRRLQAHHHQPTGDLELTEKSSSSLLEPKLSQNKQTGGRRKETARSTTTITTKTALLSDSSQPRDRTVELDRRGAVIEGLANVGVSVFSGTFTSFLGILVLALAEHGILRTFFKFYFSIFLFALFHGLAVVPIVLSMLPPRVSTKLFLKYEKDIQRLHAGQE